MTTAIQESKMLQPDSAATREQVADTMIGLTRLSSSHRVIVAGSDSLELFLCLRRRGLVHVTTTTTCRIPRRQHAIGLITGQGSLLAIETALAQISQFLSASAAIAILIDSRDVAAELNFARTIRSAGIGAHANARVFKCAYQLTKRNRR